eukprot:7040186-Lingulodinium_polyedra.AAC.1
MDPRGQPGRSTGGDPGPPQRRCSADPPVHAGLPGGPEWHLQPRQGEEPDGASAPHVCLSGAAP